MGSNQDVTTTKLTDLFEDKRVLSESEMKIGQVYFTKEQKLALSKLVGTPVWEILKTVYVKQRLVQLAVAGLNVSQSEQDLFFYKGKSAEANQFVKEIELVVAEFNREEEAKNKSTS